MTGSADERERLLSAPHTKRGDIQRVVLDLLDQHEADGGVPTNGRFVFYELEQRGHATKPSPDDQRRNRRRNVGLPGGQQDITDELTRLRDWGVIPWSWIMDEERRLFVWGHAPTIASYVLDRLDDARMNPWRDRLPPLILSESKATAGVLAYAVAAEYRCPITGTKGQSTGFLITVTGPR